MLRWVILTLHRVGIDRQAQSGTDVGPIHLAAHDLHLGEEDRCGLAGFEDQIVVVEAIHIGPVGGINVHFQAVLSRQGLIGGGADQLHPEVEGMAADILYGHLFGNNVAGDDIHAFFRERRAVGGTFMDLQLNLAGGHHVGRNADGGIVGQGWLRQDRKEDRNQSEQQQFGLSSHWEASFLFICLPCVRGGGPKGWRGCQSLSQKSKIFASSLYTREPFQQSKGTHMSLRTRAHTGVAIRTYAL